MKMPVLSPIPIRTRGKSFFTRIGLWLFGVRTWEVLEDWEYDLPDGRRIIIPEGFIFDGASIPRAFWNLLSPTGLLFIPAIIHDFSYRFNYIWVRSPDGSVHKDHENAGKRYWDKLLYEIGEHVNGMKIVNFPVWLIISTLGWLAWRANRKRNMADIMPDDSTMASVAMPDEWKT